MLHRVRKQVDINKGKWIGVGGKFEEGECPEDCLRREVREETGFELDSWKYRGMLTFIYDNKSPEYIFVYSSTDFSTGSIEEMPEPDCDEGIFKWVPKSDIMSLELWEGDRYMLDYLIRDRSETFSLRLVYNAEDELTEAWELSEAPVRLK